MKITNKTLYQKLPEIKSFNSILNVTLIQQMVQLMSVQGGVGLSANQIGKTTRMFIMVAGGQLRACFNPKVIKSSMLTKTMLEGCLSFKGEFIEVDRPMEIDVSYQDMNGVQINEKLTDFQARVFLHELDHLDGITMQKRAKLNEQQCQQ